MNNIKNTACHEKYFPINVPIVGAIIAEIELAMLRYKTGQNPGHRIK